MNVLIEAKAIQARIHEMAAEIENLVWDQHYAENLPAGFSYTADWEEPYQAEEFGFDYGVASYTAEFEGPYGDADLWELDDVRQAERRRQTRGARTPGRVGRTRQASGPAASAGRQPTARAESARRR